MLFAVHDESSVERERDGGYAYVTKRANKAMLWPDAISMMRSSSQKTMLHRAWLTIWGALSLDPHRLASRDRWYTFTIVFAWQITSKVRRISNTSTGALPLQSCAKNKHENVSLDIIVCIMAPCTNHGKKKQKKGVCTNEVEEWQWLELTDRQRTRNKALII